MLLMQIGVLRLHSVCLTRLNVELFPARLVVFGTYAAIMTSQIQFLVEFAVAMPSHNALHVA